MKKLTNEQVAIFFADLDKTNRGECQVEGGKFDAPYELRIDGSKVTLKAVPGQYDESSVEDGDIDDAICFSDLADQFGEIEEMFEDSISTLGAEDFYDLIDQLEGNSIYELAFKVDGDATAVKQLAANYPNTFRA